MNAANLSFHKKIFHQVSWGFRTCKQDVPQERDILSLRLLSVRITNPCWHTPLPPMCNQSVDPPGCCETQARRHLKLRDDHEICAYKRETKINFVVCWTTETSKRFLGVTFWILSIAGRGYEPAYASGDQTILFCLPFVVGLYQEVEFGTKEPLPELMIQSCEQIAHGPWFLCNLPSAELHKGKGKFICLFSALTKAIWEQTLNTKLFCKGTQPRGDRWSSLLHTRRLRLISGYLPLVDGSPLVTPVAMQSSGPCQGDQKRFTIHEYKHRNHSSRQCSRNSVVHANLQF